MKISEVLKSENFGLSFEVFPPKTETAYESVQAAVDSIAENKPSFMSVTYGAGGGTSEYTVSIAREIQQKNVVALAHLSCISSTRKDVETQLVKLRDAGIENILALRGDIPQGMSVDNLEYHYASELASDIKKFGGFCIGGACYPEGHPDSKNQKEDIENLKKKIDAGCEFLTTQMFFDNNIMYNYLYKLRSAGINVPVLPGIMPVTNGKQIERILKLSGSCLPPRFKFISDKFGDDPEAMTQAGIAYATEQIIDLFANGITHVHVYSMNKGIVAKKIRENLSSIVK
ncbi:MAG: methylenetetrahydrofolate reductase [Treponema sp.]|nr:methylenetetrahydrofolate reductase [NAD(P)H] [Treponema sp.]